MLKRSFQLHFGNKVLGFLSRETDAAIIFCQHAYNHCVDTYMQQHCPAVVAGQHTN